MIADCASRLQARHEGANGAASADRLAALESKLDAVCEAVTELTAAVAGSAGRTPSAGNGKPKTKSRTSA